jgi:hypothetical protein
MLGSYPRKDNDDLRMASGEAESAKMSQMLRENGIEERLEKVAENHAQKKSRGKRLNG